MNKNKILPKRVIAKHAQRVRVSINLDHRDWMILHGLGVDEDCLPDSVITVDFDSLGFHYHGIGLRNEAGGFQFYGPSYHHPLLTVGKKGIILLRKKGRKELSCLLFATLADYFRFLSCHSSDASLSSLDVVIINEWENFHKAVLACVRYDNIYCCLPSTTAGSMMFMTLKDVVSGKCNKISCGVPKRSQDSVPSSGGLSLVPA